ncbi:MAG: flippase-like domain-containing protein [Treponema sp.]|nr:flippase-like domain-containing protein [Treponema sp.]
MRKKILWAVITLCLSVLTIIALFYNGGLSLPELWQDIREATLGWLVAAAFCMLGFIFFEGRSLVLILRTLGYPARKRRGFLYASADIYFSSITPSATGGQPASAYFMHKDGISGSAVVVSLILNLTMYTLAIVSLGLLSIVFFPGIFMEFNLACKLMILVGVFAMVVLAVFFVILLKRHSILLGMGDIIVSVLNRFHCRAAARKVHAKLDEAIEKYNECVELLSGRKRLLLKTYLLNLLQRTLHVLVTVFCSYAMHGRLGDGLKVFAIQTYVVLGSNFIPVPGAVGISEYIMYHGYVMLLDDESSYTLALLSRGISFYTCCAISIVTVLLGYIQLRLRKNKGDACISEDSI